MFETLIELGTVSDAYAITPVCDKSSAIWIKFNGNFRIVRFKHYTFHMQTCLESICQLLSDTSHVKYFTHRCSSCAMLWVLNFNTHINCNANLKYHVRRSTTRIFCTDILSSIWIQVKELLMAYPALARLQKHPSAASICAGRQDCFAEMICWGSRWIYVGTFFEVVPDWIQTHRSRIL